MGRFIGVIIVIATIIAVPPIGIVLALFVGLALIAGE